LTVATEAIGPTFEAFADPTRRKILTLLSQREHAATELADAVGTVGRTAVSMHLRILRSAGLLRERREGRYRYYSLNPAPADEAVQFLQGLHHSSLSRLKAAAESGSGEADTGAARAAKRTWANSS
jgi:DNA-binding transcriptional ArsR family regulator